MRFFLAARALRALGFETDEAILEQADLRRGLRYRLEDAGLRVLDLRIASISLVAHLAAAGILVALHLTNPRNPS